VTVAVSGGPCARKGLNETVGANAVRVVLVAPTCSTQVRIAPASSVAAGRGKHASAFRTDACYDVAGRILPL
jgi:hypothetical protein